MAWSVVVKLMVIGPSYRLEEVVESSRWWCSRWQRRWKIEMDAAIEGDGMGVA